MSQQCSTAIARMGIDIGKSVFHVVGLDASGKPVFRNRFTRERLLEFLARASPTIIGMEACPGSNWLARKAIGQGHQVRIVPAQFVKPFVKSNKTDIVDAEAIAEAISRPTMRFTQPKTEAQLDLQALTKRGNPYLRKLLIHGARACVLHLDRTKDHLGLWISQMEAKGIHRNKVIVALANKLARIAWTILTRRGTFYLRQLEAR